MALDDAPGEQVEAQQRRHVAGAGLGQQGRAIADLGDSAVFEHDDPLPEHQRLQAGSGSRGS